jgi:hypothetical protein
MTFMALIELLKKVGVILALLSPLLLFIKQVREAFRGLFRWPFGKKPELQLVSEHRVELKITPGFHYDCFWSEASNGVRPMMQVACKLNVANTGPTDIFQIVDAYIEKPRTRSATPLHLEGPYGGRLAHRVSLIFFIDPVRKSGEAFICDITLVDQFAQPHTIKGMNFIHLGGEGWKAMKASGLIKTKIPGE